MDASRVVGLALVGNINLLGNKSLQKKKNFGLKIWILNTTLYQLDGDIISQSNYMVWLAGTQPYCPNLDLELNYIFNFWISGNLSKSNLNIWKSIKGRFPEDKKMLSFGHCPEFTLPQIWANCTNFYRSRNSRIEILD